MLETQVQLEDLIGKPFEWGGRGDPGYDCYTLAQEVTRRGKGFLPDKHIEITSIINKMTRGKLMEEAKKEFIQLDQPEPFCLVAFKRMGILFHVGIILPSCTKFIHIQKSSGVIISRLNNLAWKFMREGYYKYNVNCNS